MKINVSFKNFKLKDNELNSDRIHFGYLIYSQNKVYKLSYFSLFLKYSFSFLPTTLRDFDNYSRYPFLNNSNFFFFNQPLINPFETLIINPKPFTLPTT